MKIYVVGGAVRDELLGLPVKDRDYVVVGASPEEMVRLGYQPVGKDFPVFLHPQTHEEYALARTERKVARGYKGFTVHAAPDVTLEQDLGRRDLTINAIARDDEGRLIDPYRGEQDLRVGILRHVGPAFVEDPVRILRVARFSARFGFVIAPETMALLRRMVDEGEADALVPERVWQELANGLMEPLPQRLFETLAACGLAPKLFPELDLAFDTDARGGTPPGNAATLRLMRGLGHAAQHGQSLEVRFALLAFALKSPGNEGARALAERVRAPVECRDALMLAARHGDAARAAACASASELLSLLEAGDAFRRPERLRVLVDACECADFGDRGRVDDPYPPRRLIDRVVTAAAAIDAGAISRALAASPSAAASAPARVDGEAIGAAIRAARRAVIESVLDRS